MVSVSIDERVVKFLKSAIAEGDKRYSEPVFRLFSSIYYSVLDCEDYSEELGNALRDYILSVYCKFYDKLDYYLDSFVPNCRTIIKERYGLNEECKPRTHREISDILGIDFNLVIRREKQYLKRLAEMNKCVKVGDRVLDKEEYEQYELETYGKEWVEARDFDFSWITGNVLGAELQNSENVSNMFEFRDFILRKFDGRDVTEEELVKLFCSYRGCATKTAIKAVDSMKQHGFWEFLTIKEYRK